MKFFMSAEYDGRYDDFDKSLRESQNSIEKIIKDLIENRSYGGAVKNFSVIPIVIKFDPKMEKEGWFEDRVLFKKKSGEADIRLRVDYERFVKGDDEIKKKLLIENVIRSIRELGKKIKDGFDVVSFEADILRAFGYRYEDLK